MVIAFGTVSSLYSMLKSVKRAEIVISVSAQVAGLTLVTRALAILTRRRVRRMRRDSLNVQYIT